MILNDEMPKYVESNFLGVIMVQLLDKFIPDSRASKCRVIDLFLFIIADVLWCHVCAGAGRSDNHSVEKWKIDK